MLGTAAGLRHPDFLALLQHPDCHMCVTRALQTGLLPKLQEPSGLLVKMQLLILGRAACGEGTGPFHDMWQLNLELWR